MISAKFCTFSKRLRSTKRPNSNGFTTVNVALKEDCSLETPIFIVNSFNHSWNYVLFEGTYYYIRDVIVTSNNHCEIYCSKDVGATYKNEIAATGCYVAYYSGSNAYEIADTRLTQTSEPTITPLSYAPGYNNSTAFDNQRGSIVLSLVGTNTSAYVGGIEMYACDPGNIVYLSDQLLTNPTLIDELKESLDSAYDAITDAFWVPFDCNADYLGHQAQELTVGNSDIQGTSGFSLLWSFPMIPVGSQHTKRVNETFKFSNPHIGDFRDYPPYSTLVAYLPYYGNVELDIARFNEDNVIRVEVYRDYIGGYLEYNIVGETSGYRQKFTSDVKCTVSIGKRTYDRVGGIVDMSRNFLGLVSDVAGNNPYAVVNDVAGIVKGGLRYMSVDNSSKGNTRGNIALARDILASDLNDSVRDVKLYKITFDTSDEPSHVKDVIGRPYFKYAVISNLNSGAYIQCSNASVEIDGYEEDKEAVNDLMNGGFFYE